MDAPCDWTSLPCDCTSLPCDWTSLPLPLLGRCFAPLPTADCAAAACVCRSWRGAAADPALWKRLDLRPLGSISWRRINLAIGKSQGELQCLEVFQNPWREFPEDERGVDHLLRVCLANSTTLAFLRVDTAWPGTDKDCMFFNETCSADKAIEVMQGMPPYGALRLTAVCLDECVTNEARIQVFKELEHYPVERLALGRCFFPWGGLDYMNGGVQRTSAADHLCHLLNHPTLHSLYFTYCKVPPEEVVAVGEALASLLAADCPVLTYVELDNVEMGEAGLRPVLAALSLNTHLRGLQLVGEDVSPAFDAEVILPAVRSCSSLVVLRIDGPSAAADFVAARKAARKAGLQ